MARKVHDANLVPTHGALHSGTSEFRFHLIKELSQAVYLIVLDFLGLYEKKVEVAHKIDTHGHEKQGQDVSRPGFNNLVFFPNNQLLVAQKKRSNLVK